jgi:hypothetical protein
MFEAVKRIFSDSDDQDNRRSLDTAMQRADELLREMTTEEKAM